MNKPADNRDSTGKFKRGKSGNPKGRKKGSTNKFTDLKKAYLDVFEEIEIEGQRKDTKIKTLFAWATKNDKNQGMFYQMIAKMLPSSIGGLQGDDGEFQPLKVIIKKDGATPD